jgi:hypothetical protein
VLDPRLTVCEAGDALSAKSPGPVTVRVTVVAWMSVPLVPVIVIVYEPAAVEALVATLRLDVPEPVSAAGDAVRARVLGRR